MASVNLAGINMGSFNLGSINLEDPLAVGEGILALMNNFCLGQAVNLNAVLGLGINGEVGMFLELAQLAQLESLGFLNVAGAQNLILSNLLNGNQGVFNLGKLMILFSLVYQIALRLCADSRTSRVQARGCADQAHP